MINSEIQWFFNHLKNKEPFAFSRFNDGEMGGIMYKNFTAARGDQFVTEELANALKSSLIHKQKNYYVGIPCSKCFPEMYQYAENLIRDYEFKTKATILINRNWKNFIDNVGEAVSNYDILWIGGEDQNITALPFTPIHQIKIPSKNSWRFYLQLKDYYHEIPKNYLVMISLGPTARVLTQQWFFHRPDLTVLDIGSCFDPFTRGVYHNYHKGWDTTGFNLTNKCSECN